jgi:hypothetical protein
MSNTKLDASSKFCLMIRDVVQVRMFPDVRISSRFLDNPRRKIKIQSWQISPIGSLTRCSDGPSMALLDKIFAPTGIELLEHFWRRIL